ncbi:MAG: divalent-cation tolerance protein CutA [Leptolyngbyaceae cyanobacterium SM2_5_2]|nr:divalent-cation tolerance protein CutA [Leptolyngbyaceae cyanobacterium SM2_5_2]
MSPSSISQSDHLSLVLVTIDSEANALALARQLVEAKLAACVNLNPVQSVYRWQGDLHTDTEWQLFIKTDLNYLEELAQFIQQHHPYDLPEIIAVPIVAGLAGYLSWVTEELGD